MPASPVRPSEPPSAPLDTLLGLLLALPALALAWPDCLRHVPPTESAGAGWALLFSLPAISLLALRGAPRAGVPLLCVAAVALWAEWQGRSAADAFEARRASLVLTTGLLLLCAGARLGAAGRRSFTTAAVVAGLAHLVGVLWMSHSGGTLGNSGDWLELVLPTAAAGAALFIERRGLFGLAGGALLAGFAVVAGWTPAWAGAAGLLGCSALAWVASLRTRGLARHGRVLLLAGGLVVALAAWRTSQSAPEPPPPADSEAAASSAVETPDSSGGVAFRLGVWSRVPAILAEHTWTGFGPGQFEAHFPPFRDPLELLRSSHGRREPTPVDVEHLHNDWLEGLVEHGVLFGSLWVLGLASLLFAALRALFLGERSAVALAVLAGLISAAVNSPLLMPVGAHAVFWPFAGALLARPAEPAAATPRARLIGLALGLLALTHVAAALAFVRQGAALAGLAEAPKVETELGTMLAPSPQLLAIARGALAATPDSVDALGQLARHPLADDAERRAAYRSILEARPYRREALVNSGILAARAGDYPEAAVQFERAATVDPGFPGLFKNRLLLAIDADDRAGLPGVLAAHNAEAPTNRATLEQAVLAALERGRIELAELLVAALGEPAELSDANVCWQLAQAAQDAGNEPRAFAFFTAAHLLFARDHLDHGDPATAVRSYRQAWKFSGQTLEISLELAGALCLAEEREAAADLLAPLAADEVGRARFPEWAREQLAEAGLVPR